MVRIIATAVGICNHISLHTHYGNEFIVPTTLVDKEFMVKRPWEAFTRKT
jgi:hypothetical protein